ncbi:MAG: ATP-binding protein [Gemmatimonadales bacterium]
MTLQRRLLLGASLMVLPVLLVGAEAFRTNALERRALETLGTGLGRNRTYAELETAMFDQVEAVWRALTGLDPDARREFQLSGQVVVYRLEQWRSELGSGEQPLADQVATIQREIVATGDSVFRLADAGQHDLAFKLALVELKGRLQPALTALNRQIYRQARENSVSAAFARVKEIVLRERVVLIAIVLGAMLIGLLSAWMLARSLTRPITGLGRAMVVVGGGQLDHPIDTSARDEIGDLARSFADMTGQLRSSQDEMHRLNAELAGKVAQLETTRDQLVQSEKLASIGEMAAAVAHGLRNPLASLRASAQLVQRHPTSPSAGEQLRAIVEEVDRLDRRITHLLTFSRPAPFHPLPERLGSVVQGVLPAFAERLRTQQVTLTLDFAASLPDIPLDPMKMEQVLLELIGNALDAMPAGGQLTLAARVASGPDRLPGLELEVRDTGRGISAEALPLVGQPFFTTRPDGTGLGLATARRFVEQHGGHLQLESRPDAGTTIHIWLPTAPLAAGRSA